MDKRTRYRSSKKVSAVEERFDKLPAHVRANGIDVLRFGLECAGVPDKSVEVRLSEYQRVAALLGKKISSGPVGS